MTNKERLELNNAKIEEITKTLTKKQVSPTDMLQQLVDQTNSCGYLFYKNNATNLDFISGLDTSNVTNMNYMFSACGLLTSLDLSNFDTSNVTNMSNMFDTCGDLQELNISSFDTSNVKYMTSMFNYCSALTSLDLSNFNTSKVYSMDNMFKGCEALTKINGIENFNLLSATNLNSMFNGCKALTSLDLSGWDTSNVTSMAQMFHDCSSLTSLNLSNWNTSKVTSMATMFKTCNSLVEIDLSSFDTSKVTGMGSMFFMSADNKLETIKGNINMIKVTDTYRMFANNKMLKNVTLTNIKKSLELGNSVHGLLLTNETLINTIQQLWDLTGSTSQTLTLSTTSKNNIANIYVKLITPTQEQIDADPYINNKKPCVVCEPTDEGAMTLTEYATSKNWAIA